MYYSTSITLLKKNGKSKDYMGSDLTRHQEKYNALGILDYVNSSYIEDPEDRISIIKYYFFFCREIIT